MFALFLLFHQIFCEDSCEFKNASSVSTTLKDAAEISRGFLSKFNINTTNFYPGSYIFEDLGDDFFHYFLGCVSFAIPFLFFFLFFIIFFIFSCLCSFCRCKPSKSKKPKVSLVICHFFGIIMLIIAGILFLLACLNITDGVAKISDLPDSMQVEFNVIFNNVDEIFNSTFLLINQMVYGIESSLVSLSKWLTEEGPKSVSDANSAVPLITDYEEVFTKPDQEYKTTKTQVDSSVKLNKENIQDGDSFVSRLELMDKSISPAVDGIQQLATKMIDSANDINSASQNIDDTIQVSLVNVKQDIESFQNADLAQQFDGFKRSIDSFVDSLEPVKELSFYVEKYVKPIIIAATSFLLLIAIIFAIAFFCRNKCGRCCFCIYPLYGFLLTLVILLPAIVFSACFLMIFDVCPDLENVFQAFIGENDYGDLSEALICEIETPLLDILDLDFDYLAIIDDLGEQASSSLNTFDIPQELMNNLNNYGDGFNIENNISSNNIIYDHTNTLSSLLENVNKASISDPQNLPENIKKLQELIGNEEPALETVRKLMANVIEFGSSIIPRLSSMQQETKEIVHTFTNSSKVIVSNAMNNITCRSVKCVYSPVKNAICSDLLSGMSYWLISSIILICALFILSITICMRRKQMADKPKISNDSSSSSLSEELKEFHN